jgi:hypothetical protein
MKARCAVLLFLVLLIMMPRVGTFAQADGPALASLTVSPNPDLWYPGPVGPEGREFQGKFWSAPIPETITVTAVTQDPGATFTINGQPGVSGEPITLHWDKWTPWLFLNVEITDPDGSSGQLSITLFKHITFPIVYVDTGWGGQVDGVFFNTNLAATMTVSTAPGGVKLAEATTTADADGVFRWDFRELGIPVLLQEGMEVRVTDGEVTVTHVVLPLTIDEVDFDTDTIRGTGVPGAGLEFFVWPDGDKPDAGSGEYPEPVKFGHPWPLPEGDGPGYDPRFPHFVVDASGHWEFDLSLANIDLTGNSHISVSSARWNPFSVDLDDPAALAAFDPFHKSGITSVTWYLEGMVEPGVTAVLGLDAVIVEGLGTSVSVDLTVRSSAGGSVVFTDSQVTDFYNGSANWGIPQSPDLDVVLEPGMEVTVTWGETTISAVLADLAIESVDHELDRVSGVGPAGETIAVVIITGDPTDNESTMVAFADEILIGPDGSWQVDFVEDITVGMVAGGILPGTAGFITAVVSAAVVEPVVVEENLSIAEVSDETEVVVGTAASDGSLAQVTVPPSALPSGSSVKVAAIANTEDLVAQVAVPEGTDVVLGFSISAEASDGSEVRVDFAAPVSVEFTVEADTLPADFDPDNLSIAFWNGARWAALEDVQAVTNADGSVTLSALTDHFTLFTVVTDPAGAIRPGPADPLEEVSLSGLRSYGLDPYSAQTDEIQPGDEGSGGFGSLPVWIAGGVAAVILITVCVVLRRQRQTTRS